MGESNFCCKSADEFSLNRCQSITIQVSERSVSEHGKSDLVFNAEQTFLPNFQINTHVFFVTSQVPRQFQFAIGGTVPCDDCGSSFALAGLRTKASYNEFMYSDKFDD